jgi:hypothetical protein
VYRTPAVAAFAVVEECLPALELPPPQLAERQPRGGHRAQSPRAARNTLQISGPDSIDRLSWTIRGSDGARMCPVCRALRRHGCCRAQPRALRPFRSSSSHLVYGVVAFQVFGDLLEDRDEVAALPIC